MSITFDVAQPFPSFQTVQTAPDKAFDNGAATQKG